MYDREVISRSIVSPIGSGATYEEVRDSIIEGFEQKVRSIVVAPFHVELLTELAKKYDNGYTRKGMILNYPYGGFTTEYKVHRSRGSGSSDNVHPRYKSGFQYGWKIP